MRGVTAAPAEARDFAETVAAVVARHPAEDPWQPGRAASDADPDLDRALAEAGWDELVREPDLLPMVAPAAAELGRGFAALAPVDRLLGGALRVGELARYADERLPLVAPRAGSLEVAACERLEPVPYTDALGIARVEAGPAQAEPDAGRMAAWVAASTGYLAGLTARALELALEHARARHAFGRPLAALEPVQQMLADAATLSDGLELLAQDAPGLDALAHAGPAAERATALCMQVTGALGFTLEFPLQRAYRRSRAARAWADALLLAWEGPR
jgi:Acyl-CoA dehydrogenase, C-terminal domain